MGKNIETKSCKQCQASFDITDKDKAFYDKISPIFAGKKYQIPAPTLCPDCRLQKKQAFRNERSLYRRTCDASGKQIIAVYAPEQKYKIYDHKIWRSDQRNPLEYGQDFDFKRSFFQQYHELLQKVPRMSMIINRSENSEYAPYSVDAKNCYMCVSIVGGEDIYYSYQVNASNNCVDSSLCYNSQFCYECTYGKNLYACSWTLHCKDCSNVLFCRDCEGCSFCIGCANLKDKKYHIFNKSVTQKEYEELKEKFTSASFLKTFINQWNEFSSALPVKENHNVNCENVVGDHLQNCKNAFMCFDAENLEDCSYIYTLPRGAKECHDGSYSPGMELSYEAMSGVDNYNCHFVLHAWNNRDSMYIDECYHSNNLFGCIGLRNQQYCIFNKQYTKDEYEKLVSQIIEKMKADNERGEYFPGSISPFGYNETLAMEYFPLTRAEATKKGFKRSEYQKEAPKVERIIQAKELPDNIKDVSEDMLTQTIACEASGKPFRIIKQELMFYKKHGLPLPHIHPDIRSQERLKIRNSRKFWKRTCSKCGKEIQTTYAPEVAKVVYCESCYNKEIYG